MSTVQHTLNIESITEDESLELEDCIIELILDLVNTLNTNNNDSSKEMIAIINDLYCTSKIMQIRDNAHIPRKQRKLKLTISQINDI